MKLSLRLVTLFALLVYTTTWGQADSELRTKANVLFDKEQYTDATQLYLQLLSLQPKDVDLNFKYGVCLLHNSNNKSAAIRYLNFVVKEQPENADAYFFLGKAYHVGYYFDQATLNYNIYLKKCGSKGKYISEANRNIQMSANGKKLLSKITDVHVKEKMEVGKENFYRGYNLENIGGSLIQALDFQSKVDKKKGHKPVVHLLSGSELIYFSSYGDGDNLDIYVVRRLPNGNFGVPQKILGEVNTSFDEDYPYLHPNGKELFFSSKGHNSMGGYDIFKATFDPENNQFIAVENIDFAISSPDDDLLYMVDQEYKNAYFASNRQAQNGMITIYKVAVDKFPSELVILKGSFESQLNGGYKQLSIEVYDYQTNRRIGKFQTNESADYVVVLPRGGKYLFKSSSGQFNGNFSQVVEVPHLDVVRPLRQYAKHFTKGTGTDVQFINAFDEKIENPSDVIAEALKVKGELQPNDSPITENTSSTVSSEEPIGKAAQRLGLPEWGMPALFNHVDGLVSKYNQQTEKLNNLSDILNALMFQEYQKIEKIDSKLIELVEEKKQSTSNNAVRNIDSQISELRAQRDDAVRWALQIEANKEQLLQMYHKQSSKEKYSVEHMNQIVEQLFQAQKKGEDVFVAALLNSEKEIKAVSKETPSVYKSTLTEKVTLDREIEKLQNQHKTNDSRKQELKAQLAEQLLLGETAKSKAKTGIEIQIARIEVEIIELDENNNYVNNNLIKLKSKQDSVVSLLQSVNRLEQFKGTPVSSKMVAQAQAKYTNSPVTQAKVSFETKGKINPNLVEEEKQDWIETIVSNNTRSTSPSSSDAEIKTLVKESQESEALMMAGSKSDISANIEKENSSSEQINAPKKAEANIKSAATDNDHAQSSSHSESLTINNQSNNEVESEKAKIFKTVEPLQNNGSSVTTSTDSSKGTTAKTEEKVGGNNPVKFQPISETKENEILAPEDRTQGKQIITAQEETLVEKGEQVPLNAVKENSNILTTNVVASTTEGGNSRMADRVEERTKVDSAQNSESSQSSTAVERVENFRFLIQLEESQKALLQSIDKNYVTRVEKLEARSLNPGEQRVLIDLHRKFLEKVEEQQSAIQFGDRIAKTADELEFLAQINDQLTQSIQHLNNLLSNDVDETKIAKEVGQTTKVEAPHTITDKEIKENVVSENTFAKSDVNSQNEAAPIIDKELNHSVANTSEKEKEDSKSLVTNLDEGKSANQVIQPISEEIKENVEQSNTESEKNRNATAESWRGEEASLKNAVEIEQIQKQINQLNEQIVQQEIFLSKASTKSDKSEIQKAINEIKKQEQNLFKKQDDLIFESIYDTTTFQGESQISDLERAYVKEIESMTAIIDSPKKKTDVNRLSKDRLNLTYELVGLNEYESKVSYVKESLNNNVSMWSSAQLSTQIQYLEMEKGHFEQQLIVLKNTPVKTKAEKGKLAKTIGEVNDVIAKNEQLTAALKLRFETENKYISSKQREFVAPDYVEEYRILASKEYVDYALVKARLIEEQHELERMQQQLDQMRAEVQELYHEEGKSARYRQGLIEIGELVNARNAKQEGMKPLKLELLKVTPNDKKEHEYFENLVSRALNPIVHKVLDEPLVDLNHTGISFENKKEKRNELDLSTPKGLVYRVQVGAFKQAVSPELFKEFSPVTTEMIPNSSIKRYIAGYFSNMLMAQSAKDEIREIGYKDAFLIAYCDGERITIEQAKILEKEGLCNPSYIEELAFQINRSNIERAKVVEREKMDWSTVSYSDYNKAAGSANADVLEGREGLYFTVQVGVYNRPVGPERFFGQQPLFTLRIPNGQLRYSVGLFTDLSAARAREKELRSVGLRDAYVVAYYQGERIAIYQAMDLMDKGVIPNFSSSKQQTNVETKLIKEELPVFTSGSKPKMEREKEFVQLISVDSFNSIPVDFLNRFRSKSYFYYDASTGFVKSQLVERHHFLTGMVLLKPYFRMEGNLSLMEKEQHLPHYILSIPGQSIDGELGDFLLRISHRIELKELDKGLELHIFVPNNMDAEFIEMQLKNLDISFKKNIQSK